MWEICGQGIVDKNKPLLDRLVNVKEFTQNKISAIKIKNIFNKQQVDAKFIAQLKNKNPHSWK